MGQLSKLTLKGYFEQLRSQTNELSGKTKAVTPGEAGLSHDEQTNKLLELAIKAVALIEEIHTYDSDFLHDDHINDYRSMIATLNLHGIAYKGSLEILQSESRPSLGLSAKKPMQKADSRKKQGKSQSSGRRKTG